MRIAQCHWVSSDPLDLDTTHAVPAQRAPTVIASGTLSASFSSVGLNISHEYGYAVHAIVSGSLTGSLTLYGSCEQGSSRQPPQFANQTAGQSQAFLNQGINAWVPIANTTTQLSCSTLGGAVSVLINAEQQFYRWVQCRFALSSSLSGSTVVAAPTQNTGSIDVWFTAKGAAV